MKEAPSSAQNRSARLSTLKAQRRAITAAPGYQPLSDPRWPHLCREIRTLEQSFVLYQGRELDAEVANEVDGSLNVTPDLHHEGCDRLYRTADGTYYLHRELHVLDVDGSRERRASGRTLVHRMSVTAAALEEVRILTRWSHGFHSETTTYLLGLPRRAHRDRQEVSVGV